jgi:ribose transport system substrate-binding protein
MGCGTSRPADAERLSETSSVNAIDDLVIAVIPKATTFEFWKSVRAGAERAGRELGVKVIWKGPISESDRESQINLVQDFVTQRINAICLAPLDSQSLIGPVREARAAGIPTVIYDSGLDDERDIVSYVATDNANGGALAARHLGRLLDGKGDVILLRYTPGSQSSEQREEGFLRTLTTEFPDIKVVSSNEYAGATAENALDKAQQLLTQYGRQVTGIFTPCQHVSSGMLRALEEHNLAGKVKFVGFDSGPDLLRALREGKMHGLVLQDPVRMGELAVRTAVAHLRGHPVERRIATGEKLASRDNLDDPVIRRLLEPEQFDE